MTTVTILGGGSAGYLTASALRALRPDVSVAMIESNRISPIGVGEGTTPIMLPFLHDMLGIDPAEFHAKVRPTWKVGVRLTDWGASPGHFEFPFDARLVADSYTYHGHVNEASIGSRLMGQRSGIHTSRPDFTMGSLASLMPHAYHLDSSRLLAFLTERASELGIQSHIADIVDVEHRPDGSIAALVDDTGHRHQADIFVDCSGFRSMLLGGALQCDYVSYEESLRTDRAIVGSGPRHGPMAPFTEATAMRAGWAWCIPQHEDDRYGYVYSSRHLSSAEAEAELRRLRPEMGEVRELRFKPGRHDKWIDANVVAIGNSYGFVEPLEATALHMIVRQISMFVASIDQINDGVVRRDLNDTVADLWDGICGTLAVHYQFNQRFDNSFWREVRSSTDLGVAGPMVDDVFARGTASSDADTHHEGTLLAGLRDEVVLLMLGMHAIDKSQVTPTMSSQAWLELSGRLDALASTAVSAEDSIRLAARDPSSIDATQSEWYQGVRRALTRQAPAMAS